MLHAVLEPQHASEWINGITGAFGAAVGSMVTIIFTAWFNRRTRAQERREKFAAGAFGAFQRLNQIYSISLGVRDHLLIGQSAAEKSKARPCFTTMALHNPSEPVRFPLEELWTVTQLGGPDLVNAVVSLDHAFNQILRSMEKYSVLRDEVFRLLPSPDEMEGVSGHMSLDASQMKRLLPKFAVLDSVLEQVADNATSLSLDAFTAITRLVRLKSHPLGKAFSVTLPDPNHTDVTISATDGRKVQWSRLGRVRKR